MGGGVHDIINHQSTPMVPSHYKLEVFREDIPRAAYVNSDRATAVSGCRQSIKSDEFLRIVSKQLYTFSKSCLLAVEPSAFVKQPIKGWNHII